MARIALIGMNVGMQRRELMRLDEISRHRRLSDAESAMLAELLRLDGQRRRDQKRRIDMQIERARLRVAQLERVA